jgi:hypothetical protein
MRIFFASLIIITSLAHSESWIEVSGDYECPDLLVLSESMYEIYNDCYGFDPRNPIVDSGNIERNEGVITFTKRTIKQPSFLGEEGNKEFEVLIKTEKELSIRSGDVIHSFKVFPVAK